MRIFRVDNPHTKPFPFWEWMIREVQDRYPDVIFLSEAFTRPKPMQRLAKLGFTQSYTYFTWRNTKAGADRVPDRAHAKRDARVLPAEFFRQHARHQSGLPADERARRLPGASHAGGDARRQLRHLQRLRALRRAAHPRQGGISQLREVRDPGLGLGPRRAISARTSRSSTVCAASIRPCSSSPISNSTTPGTIRSSTTARQRPDNDDFLLFAVNLDPHNAQAAHFEVPLWEFGLPDDACDRRRGPRYRKALHVVGQGAAHAARSQRPALRRFGGSSSRKAAR